MTNVKLNDEQSLQLQNISETLIEATTHFVTDIKSREFAQSIHIFSSIVEGYDAINQMFTIYEKDSETTQDLLGTIESNLILIAKELEQKRFIKITEIVQFSLIPNFKRLNQYLSTHTIDQSITIGIYHDRVNPRSVYPKDRIDALIHESDIQQTTLLFFASEDVDFKTKKVHADIYRSGHWEKIMTDFPDVIHNIGVASKHQQTITERKLRRQIPFTSFYVGNKFSLPKKMLKHRRFAELLVPFKMIENENVVYDYLDNHEIAVLKPILGARGESIYFIQKKGSRFIVSEHRQERIYNRDRFNEWLQTTIVRRKFSYMIQRYVECQTKAGEPFDIRAHMQKNKAGKWVITRIYPRIGSKHSILSNISRGGRTENLQALLIKEFGDQSGSHYEKELRKLSIELTEYLDRIHNFSLDELGLDLAIDNTGRIWLHEANNGPQSTYHEAERAVHTIGYAVYIAKNGIIKHNQLQNHAGQFNAKTSDLSFAKIDNRHRIGMLKSDKDDEELAIACAYVAHYENVYFYTFTPKDIDYNEMLIKGQFYENGEWVSKIVEYPDVIYDRFRLKGVKSYNDVYEELEGIPFTNEFYGNSISKLEVYDKLKSTGELDDIIIPYKKVEKVRDIFQYMDAYGAVIVKPEVGSFARGVHYIAKQENNNYFVAESDKETEYSEIALRKYLNELLEAGTFIVQQYINTRTIDDNPFDIRVHMMKDGNDEWDFVTIYPRIGLRYATIMAMNIGGYTGKIEGFLDRNFPQLNTISITNKIKDISVKITERFSGFYDLNFNEIAFDFALNSDGEIYLIELNVNKPGITVFEFDLARFAIPNAIYVSKQKEGTSI